MDLNTPKDRAKMILTPMIPLILLAISSNFFMEFWKKNTPLFPVLFFVCFIVFVFCLIKIARFDIKSREKEYDL